MPQQLHSLSPLISASPIHRIKPRMKPTTSSVVKNLQSLFDKQSSLPLVKRSSHPDLQRIASQTVRFPRCSLWYEHFLHVACHSTWWTIGQLIYYRCSLPIRILWWAHKNSRKYLHRKWSSIILHETSPIFDSSINNRVPLWIFFGTWSTSLSSISFTGSSTQYG